MGRLWMHLYESTPLEEYSNGVKKLNKYSAKFEKIYCGHTKYDEDYYRVKFVNKIINDVFKFINSEITGTYLNDYSEECLVCEFGDWSIWYKINE